MDDSMLKPSAAPAQIRGILQQFSCLILQQESHHDGSFGTAQYLHNGKAERRRFEEVV
jgi:hypothetical protein